MFWTFLFLYLSLDTAPGCEKLKQPPGGIWAGKRSESLPAYHFCLAGIKMMVAKHCLPSLILMWFILVSRVSLFTCGSDQAVIFQSDWPSFSQQFASAMISACLCNPRNFREVWGRVCEPNQSEAVLLLAVSKYDPCGWFDSLVWPQIPFPEDYKAQTNILICDKQWHKVIYGEKIQSNSAPVLFWFFFYFISTICNYRHEIQVISGLYFLLRKLCL